jgi:hypothetical protein
MQNTNLFNGAKTAFTTFKIVIIVLSILAPVFYCHICYATVADPDSPGPSIDHLHVNQNLVLPGDRLYYGIYNLPYATLPTVPANQTFLFRLLNFTGTEIGQITVFPYFQLGYNQGLFAFYLPPTGAPNWNAELTIRISENPAQFATPKSWDFTIAQANYSTLDTQTLNQGELTSKLIEIARILEVTYSISLVVTSGSMQILTVAGETYFGGSIQGLQAMTPQLYLVQSYSLDLESTEWTTEQFDAYENRFNGTWVGTDIQATATQWGISPTMVWSLIVTLPICLAFIIFSSIKFKKADPGFVVCALMLIMSVLMGWVPKAIFASIYQLCGIFIAYIIFYARG